MPSRVPSSPSRKSALGAYVQPQAQTSAGSSGINTSTLSLQRSEATSATISANGLPEASADTSREFIETPRSKR